MPDQDEPGAVGAMAPAPAPPARRCRPPRIGSVAGLMILILLVALALAWSHQIIEEREAVRFCLENLQGRVYYEADIDYTNSYPTPPFDVIDPGEKFADRVAFGQGWNAPTPAPRWLRGWIGDEPFRTPIAAEIGGTSASYLSDYSIYSTDAGLARVCRLRSLRFLWVYSARVNGAGLAHLERLPSLERLYLIGSFGGDQIELDAGDLAHLRRLPRLKHLSISERRLTGGALAEIGKLERLESLDLEFTLLPEGGLALLSGLRSLRRLNGLSLLARRDDDLRHLAPLESLESVDLSDTSITGAALVHLGALRSLKRLAIASRAIRDGDLRHLAKCSRLEWLRLGGGEIVGPGLAVWREYRRSKFGNFFRLPDPPVSLTAEAIPHLAAIPALEVLDLDLETTRKLEIGPALKMASGRELRESSPGHYGPADAP